MTQDHANERLSRIATRWSLICQAHSANRQAASDAQLRLLLGILVLATACSPTPAPAFPTTAIGLFAAIVCGSLRRWGKVRAMWLIPFVWTGIEYFRSELYYLKFSWLNVGYAFAQFPIKSFYSPGEYGVGFAVAAYAAIFIATRRKPFLICGAITAVVIAILSYALATAILFADGAGAIVVEATPRVRFNHPGWTTHRLRQLAQNNKAVRISGWLLMDQEHPDQITAGIRGTLWEIHPIMQIEVQAAGQWIALDDDGNI
jgi:hypothetical protein